VLAVEIVDYRPEHAHAFRTLNEAWMLKHFTLDADEREVLADPEGEVIAGGGRIFMALKDGRAVGCVALFKLPDGGFEIANMTVAESERGSGLGRALLERCFDAASAAKAPRLYLEAGSVLAPALSLYRSMGFKPVRRAPADSDAQFDVVMERRLP
jgi:putative acetyltransferase